MIYNARTREYTEEKDSKFLKMLYNNIIGRIVLKLLTRKPLTSLVGFYMSSKLSTRRIPKFIKKNNINMDEYIKEEYKSFNDFFIRKIEDNSRQLADDHKLFLSPADAKLTVYPIDDDTVLHIKNSKYTIEEIIRDKKLADKYKGGYCLVYRLCVDDYHRYFFIDDGEIKKQYKIKGQFHTVQPIAFKKYKVFSENSRECSILETKNFGVITQIEVGAMMVGKIVNHELATFQRGNEKGYFCFGGSTVVLLVEKDKVVIDKKILEHSLDDIETRVLLYDIIGRKRI